MRPPEGPAAAALLALPAWLYGAAVRFRNRRYDRARATRRAGLPVISVGNLTVGGTGKTPLIAWLAAQLTARGLRPAVVSRGYGGQAGRGPLVVSGGDGPTCSARVCGDEPALLARALPGAIVVVGSDRVAGAERARAAGADLALLDDGFQHRRLARDLDIVLLDSTRPFGNGRLLPAGPLREPIDALARADVVVITRSRPGQRSAEIERVVREHNAGATLLGAGHRPCGFVDGHGRPVEQPARIVAFCGIGNPTAFRADLEALGPTLAGFRAFGDHHRYRANELSGLLALARLEQATLVTTEKDLVRLEELLPGATPGAPIALRIEAEPHQADALIERVVRAAGRNLPTCDG